MTNTNNRKRKYDTDYLINHLETLNINSDNSEETPIIKRSKRYHNMYLLDNNKPITKYNFGQVFNIINNNLDMSFFKINIKLTQIDNKLKELESNMMKLKTGLESNKEIDKYCSYIN